jgi:hypothetical protein
MRERVRFFTVLVGCCAVGFFAMSGSAAATDIPTTNTTIPSFSDPRTDMPNRPGETIVRSRYGPFTVAANSEVHNALGMVQPPCTNCYITDIVPNLVYTDGTDANLNTGIMMHHFVLSHPGRTDPVCPGGLQTNIPPPFGPGSVERFFASGNERTHMHLPGPYGYYSTAPSQNGSNGGYLLIYHLVNRAAVSKTVSIQVTYAYKTAGAAGDKTQPLWLDIDGCGDSEYSAPVGYSDTHADWTSTVDGRMIAISGHLHDLDITNANPCIPAHCDALGDGIAISAEVLGGPASDYFGPSPPNNPPPADLTAATLCRSQGYYGSNWAVNTQGNQYNGHLDTMSVCGVFTDKPASAQAEAYPASATFPSNGYRINKNQVIRLHTEYQNNNTQPQNDVMGIMVGWLVPPTTYVRPKGATPILTALVPAYQACGSPNRVHLGGINNSSCNPPNQTSGQATFGTPDANTFVANGSASVRMDVCPVAGCVAGNMKIAASVADVRQKATPANDYSGELQLKPTLRITDRNNGASEGGTVVDTPFGVTVPCTTTPGDATIGSSCSVSTTVNSVVPNAIAATNRAILEVGQIQVYDGGSDGVASTSPNTLFAVQGVFIP